MKLSSVSESTDQCEAIVGSRTCNSQDAMQAVGGTPQVSDYWETLLSETQPLDLPTDRMRPAMLGTSMGVAVCRLDGLQPGLRRLSSEQSVNIGSCVLAAFAVLLYRYTSQEKFVIAVPSRCDESLPIAVDFSEKPSFRLLLEQLEHSIDDTTEAGPFPLAFAAKFDSDSSRHPIYQVAFSAQGIPFPKSNPHSAGLDLCLRREA